MKQVLLFFFLSWGSIFSFTNAIAQNIPEPLSPPQFVNDYVGLFSKQERIAMEKILKNYFDTTSTQIAVVCIRSTDEYPIADYSFKLAEKWGIGIEGKNNGLLVLIAKNDRDVFIASGYGLEEKLTDARCKKIIEEQIVPNFKNEDYYTGTQLALQEIIYYLSGDYTVSEVDITELDKLMKENEEALREIEASTHINYFSSDYTGIWIGLFLVILIMIFCGIYMYKPGLAIFTFFGIDPVSLSKVRSGKTNRDGSERESSFSISFGGSSSKSSSFGGFGGGHFGGGGAGGKW